VAKWVVELNYRPYEKYRDTQGPIYRRVQLVSRFRHTQGTRTLPCARIPRGGALAVLKSGNHLHELNQLRERSNQRNDAGCKHAEVGKQTKPITMKNVVMVFVSVAAAPARARASPHCLCQVGVVSFLSFVKSG